MTSALRLPHHPFLRLALHACAVHCRQHRGTLLGLLWAPWLLVRSQPSLCSPSSCSRSTGWVQSSNHFTSILSLREHHACRYVHDGGARVVQAPPASGPGQVMPKHARLIGHCQAAARCTPGFHVLLHAAAKQLPLQLAHSPRLQPDSNCCEGCTLQSCCSGPICAINCPKALPDLSLSQRHGVGPRYRLLHGPALAGCRPKGLLQMCCARRQRLKVLQYSSSKRPFSQGQRRGTTDGNNKVECRPDQTFKP